MTEDSQDVSKEEIDERTIRFSASFKDLERTYRILQKNKKQEIYSCPFRTNNSKNRTRFQCITRHRLSRRGRLQARDDERREESREQKQKETEAFAPGKDLTKIIADLLKVLAPTRVTLA